MKIIKVILSYLFVINLSYSYAQQKKELNQPIAIVIHGGAGTILKKNMTPELEKEYKEVMERALTKGYEVLKNGGSAVDAVETAIKILEDSPLFNAGKGSVFTNEETNEMDASIMDGKSLNAGAVAGVKTIKNPITAARLVMEQSPHVMLAGDGADQYAKEKGLEIVKPEYFFNQKRYDQLKSIKSSEEIKLDHSEDEEGFNPLQNDSKFGTVGCVALDREGNIAAGTSTGGMTNKKHGRIGDSPIIGAGTYANEQVGVSCTGHGEYFIRYTVAYDLAALMKYKQMTLQEAANTVIFKKLLPNNGSGGLIALDKDGNIAMPFNTAGMYRGFIDVNGNLTIQIFK